MIGLLYILFFGIYLWLSVKAVKLAARWAKSRRRSPRVWGFLAGLLMYSLIFWDLIPTYALHGYYCTTRAGFTLNKTLEQWKRENPDVWEKLAPAGEAPPEAWMANPRRIPLNQRFVWETVVIRHPFHIREREERIVDIKTGEVLARYVDFDTDILGVSRGYGARGISDYKEWLILQSCRDTGFDVIRTEFMKLKHMIKYKEETRQ